MTRLFLVLDIIFPVAVIAIIALIFFEQVHYTPRRQACENAGNIWVEREKQCAQRANHSASGSRP